jgi:hexosaminidase
MKNVKLLQYDLLQIKHLICSFIKYCLLFIVLISSAFFAGAQNILPTPQVFNLKEGNFIFPKRVGVYSENRNAYFLHYLKETVLLPTRNSMSSTNQKDADIVFLFDKAMSKEAYTMDVTPLKIQIKASGDAGFFYAIQSLFELRMTSNPAQIPSLHIADSPRYKWRSFMLDVARQFQTVATVKKYLDMMAMLKMNVFHWHLTDDQGWRLEIKKYPELTRKGAFLSKGPGQQGFYTQEDVKKIVRYAAMRNITVVPEIDMPGHAEAAIFAYPELTCFGQSANLSGQSFSENILCAGKPYTMQFLKNVLDEVCELFPSKYIHVGGDEVRKDSWDKCSSCQALIKEKDLKNSEDLQRYFSAEIANYLKLKGRKAIFWGDIMYHNGYKLPDNVVIDWWNWRVHKDTAYKAAIESNHEVICGTNYYTYLNFPVSPWKEYKANRTFDIEDIYEKNPSMNREGDPLVLGMSCSLWCDLNVIGSMLDKRIFPRIFALSEQMWHKGNYLPFNTFYKEVKEKKTYFENLGYQFGPGLRSEIPKDYNWN